MLSLTVKKRIDKVCAICETLKIVLQEHGWSEYARSLLAQLQRLVIVLDDPRFDSDDYLERRIRASREDGMFEAFRDAWITTEKNHKIHIGENGDPDKGNPHVLNVIKKESEKREARTKYPRKREMVCESKVSFNNPKEVTKDIFGRDVTHFNHDENEMTIENEFELNGEDGKRYKIYPGKIEHLTVFAADGVGRGLEAAEGLSWQVGGSPESWKHVKGIGTVVDAYGKERRADIHWFESPEAGQMGWKVKMFEEDMDESQIYWGK